jgi:4-carboxymuconolactone decarboxylase
MAKDRLPTIPAAKLTEPQKAAVAAFKAARGTEPFGPFVPLMRSPEVMLRAQALGEYLRFRSALPKPLNELVILITARTWTQQYEWHHHASHALAAGLAPAIIEAVADGRRPERLSEEEAVVYEFPTELHRNRSVSDATYERARQHFGEQGVIDMTAVCGYYSMLAMVLNVARTPLPEGAAPLLRPLP